jgi:hypothetical protein
MLSRRRYHVNVGKARASPCLHCQAQCHGKAARNSRRQDAEPFLKGSASGDDDAATSAAPGEITPEALSIHPHCPNPNMHGEILPCCGRKKECSTNRTYLKRMPVLRKQYQCWDRTDLPPKQAPDIGIRGHSYREPERQCVIHCAIVPLMQMKWKCTKNKNRCA